jgi:predicted heme/steroid binding protein
MPKINLFKINRFFAWILLILMFLFIISGYGMTKGIISYELTKTLHLGYIAILLIFVFLTHSFLSVRLAFMRWRIWNITSKAVLSLAYVFILSAFTYLRIFYSQSPPSENTQSQTNQTAETALAQTIDNSIPAQAPLTIKSPPAVNSPAQSQPLTPQSAKIPPLTQPLPADPPSPIAQDQTKYFTLAELAQYNGKNGQPAYVAVNGIIYNLSAIFINGKHAGYSAGQDLTAAFNSKHSVAILKAFPIIGKLK